MSTGEQQPLVQADAPFSSIVVAGQTFHVHQWLDVQDEKTKWLEGQVRKVDEKQKLVFIHYKGFHSKYDEWLDPMGERVARLHAHTVRGSGPGIQHVRLVVDTQLDVLDSLRKWHKAQVTDVHPDTNQIRVHYCNYPNKWDEWLNVDSYRLAELHTYTKPKVPRPRPSAQQTKPICIRKSESLETRYRELMTRLGLPIHEMGGDGNCLFRAVSHQVYGTEDFHMTVRLKCMQYVESHSDFFSAYVFDEDCASYVRRMCFSGEWGGEVEVRAMGEIYDRPVEIYAYSTKPKITYGGTNPEGYPIRLSYHWNSHYNSVMSVDPGSRDRFLKEVPGAFEDRRIKMGQALRAGLEMSQESKQLQLALQRSRADFDNRDMNAAFADIVMQRDIEAAQEASLQEQDESTIIEQLMLQQIKEASQAEMDMTDDLQMQTAMHLSSLEAAALAGGSPMNMDMDDEAVMESITDQVQRESLQIPGSVTQLEAMGFDPGQVAQAYTIFYNPNEDESVITANMLQHLTSLYE